MQSIHQQLYSFTASCFRMRGLVVLKGRRPEGATDDYDTDDDAANDDMTDQQSVVSAVTVRTSTTSISSSVSSELSHMEFLINIFILHTFKFTETSINGNSQNCPRTGKAYSVSWNQVSFLG